MYQDNPEQVQNRIKDLLDMWQRHKCLVFPEQRKIYENLSKRVHGSILEAGCGIGIGSEIIQAEVATDVLAEHIEFARELYPGRSFSVWDITKSRFYGQKYDNVVAVEVIEHVADYKSAVANLYCSSKRDIWISTPNRAVLNQEHPDNPEHVHEFTTQEIHELFKPYSSEMEILHWDTFENLPWDTKVSPLVYHFTIKT